MLEHLPVSVLILVTAILLYIALFLFKDFWTERKLKIKDWESLMNQNTIAMVELKVEVRNLKEVFGTMFRKMENLEQDMDALHAQRRKDSNPLK